MPIQRQATSRGGVAADADTAATTASPRVRIACPREHQAAKMADARSGCAAYSVHAGLREPADTNAPSTDAVSEAPPRRVHALDLAPAREPTSAIFANVCRFARTGCCRFGPTVDRRDGQRPSIRAPRRPRADRFAGPGIAGRELVTASAPGSCPAPAARAGACRCCGVVLPTDGEM
jgi:hypothetical protein